MTNHYETLGISNDANEDQIKRAYRKLSLKYHPDRNPSPDAQPKFQAINEANEILGDPVRRQQYNNELNGVPMMNGGGGPEFRDMNDIFKSFFGGGGGMGMGMGMGPGIHMFNGGPNQFFENMNKPPPIVKNLVLTLAQSYSGGSFPIELEKWSLIGNVKNVEKQTIYLNVPQGIDDNEMVLLGEMGNSINHTIKGDIKICITIQNDATFERRGLDLILKRKITLKEALCGFEFEIKHISGKSLNFKNLVNHSIIQPGYKKMIPDFGMKRESHTGNLIIDFDVVFPEQLPIETITALAALL